MHITDYLITVRDGLLIILIDWFYAIKLSFSYIKYLSEFNFKKYYL